MDCCGPCFDNCCQNMCEQGSDAASSKVSRWQPRSWFGSGSSLEAPPPLPPLCMAREAEPKLELGSG